MIPWLGTSRASDKKALDFILAHAGIRAESPLGSFGFGGFRLARGFTGLQPRSSPGQCGYSGQGRSGFKKGRLLSRCGRRLRPVLHPPPGVGEGYLPPNGVSKDPGPENGGRRRDSSKGRAGPPLNAPRPARVLPRAMCRSPGRRWSGTVLENSGPSGGLGQLGKGENRAGRPGGGGRRWAQWGLRGAALTPRRPPPTFSDGSGTGALERCGCRGRLSRATAARWARDPCGEERADATPGEAPRGGWRRSTLEAPGAGETKLFEPSLPSPAPAPKPGAGERDPCSDPLPSPARAITKETRPPALPSPRRLKTDPSAGTGRLKGSF